MCDSGRLKDEMIERLWLPKAQEAGSIIYPKRKRHSQMRMLTLSDGIDLGEVTKLEEENLMKREDSVAWVSSMNKRWRIESENVGLVIDGHAYESSFLTSSCQLASQFPFDILNLDFSSQDTDMNEGRTETEIMRLERSIGLQKQNGKRKFLVIFTVPVNACNLDSARVIRESDAIGVTGWGGHSLDGYSDHIIEQCNKTDFIQAVANSVVRKHGYTCISGLESLLCSNSERILFSVAGVLVR